MIATLTRAASSLVRAARSASFAPRQAASALAKVPWPPRSRERRAQALRSSASTSAANSRVSAAAPVVPRARATCGASSPKADDQSNEASRSGFVRLGQRGSSGLGGADAAADALSSGASSGTQPPAPSAACVPGPQAAADAEGAIETLTDSCPFLSPHAVATTVVASAAAPSLDQPCVRVRRLMVALR
ncbi:MAG TPA: hypothetical protein VFS43_20245 [Polyangiaceae bacterium]|nr:hypothetical protein [Polyangiaceae bacterium]